MAFMLTVQPVLCGGSLKNVLSWPFYGIQQYQIYLTIFIRRVTLITESDTVCLYPPNPQIAKSEVLNSGMPS